MFRIGRVPGATGKAQVESDLLPNNVYTDRPGLENNIALLADEQVRSAIIMMFPFDIHMVIATEL